MTTRRQMLMEALVGAGSLGICTAAGAATPPAPACTTALLDLTLAAGIRIPTGDIHDFDFFVGKWNFVNRRLKKRWVGSKDWEVFPASLICESRMNGVVNIDDGVFPTKGWSGMTVRVFNVEQRQWALYWINSSRGEVMPPVVGGFAGDRGLFYGDDTDEGRPVIVRFAWTRLGLNAAHWEQAFSLDGKEWETNWIIEHTRAAS
jgi:hypothetical protein